MIAPSERHLEDWIVANLAWFGTRDYEGKFYPVAHRLIARQYVLDAGRPDLLVANETHPLLRIVELKRGAVDARCLAQALRYQREIANIWDNVLYSDELAERLYGADLRSPEAYERRQRLWVSPAVECVLVGYGIPDEHLQLACEAARASILRYEWLPEHNAYAFEYVTKGWRYDGEGADSVARRHPVLADALITIMRQRVDRLFGPDDEA